MIKKIKFLPLFVLCYATLDCLAQEYKMKALLDPVTETGFYKIPVTPELSAFAKADLSDLRIMDSTVFVPHIFRKTEGKSIRNESFINFPVLQNRKEGNYSVIVVKNIVLHDQPLPEPCGISELSLIIRNTAVERYTSLSGSDDRQNWYIINDTLLFHKSDDRQSEGKYVQTLSFPLSKFLYYKLKINNAHNDPLSIESAGVFRYSYTETVPDFYSNPPPVFRQKDSNGVSYVFIQNQAPYLTDEISLKLDGPKLYKRDAMVFVLHDPHDSFNYLNPVEDFIILVNKPAVVRISSQKGASILITINNNDNPPLKVTSVATSQRKQYLVVWLQKGKIYTLLAGNPAATPPAYDLGQFRDSIPQELKTLSFGPFSAVPKPETNVIKPSKNYWLWPTIVLSVLVLGFLTYRLMKDVKSA